MLFILPPPETVSLPQPDCNLPLSIQPPSEELMFVSSTTALIENILIGSATIFSSNKICDLPLSYAE
jgi:hypothetical protein